MSGHPSLEWVNITGWVQDGIAAISTPEMKQSIRRAFANDGRFTEIRARAARSQVIEDEIRIQELLGQLSLFEEPETIEELASGGDLVQDTFVEPDSDLDD